jgi:hypothetical protein
MRVCGVTGDAQGPSSELWRDEPLPFGLSVIADDRRFAELQRALSSAEDAQGKLVGRLKQFAEAYLGFDKQSKERRNKKNEGKDKDSLIGELVGFKRVKRGEETVTIPLYTDFWAEIAPSGERIACDGFRESEWADTLTAASKGSFRRAINRLPPDARRHRAEFARRVTSDANSEKGGTT